MVRTYNQARCDVCGWVSVPTADQMGPDISGREHVTEHPDGATYHVVQVELEPGDDAGSTAG